MKYIIPFLIFCLASCTENENDFFSRVTIDGQDMADTLGLWTLQYKYSFPKLDVPVEYFVEIYRNGSEQPETISFGTFINNKSLSGYWQISLPTPNYKFVYSNTFRMPAKFFNESHQMPLVNPWLAKLSLGPFKYGSHRFAWAVFGPSGPLVLNSLEETLKEHNIAGKNNSIYVYGIRVHKS